MPYKIALNFEDGITRVIDCCTGERVADAAFRQKINIPMDCRDGVCGTCKCFCEEGDYEMAAHLDEALTIEEEQQRYVLTCQMTPRSDCVLQVPTTSLACKTAAAVYEAEVIEVKPASETTFIFNLALQQRIEFLPGQYVNVSVPGTRHTRPYSFSSPSGAAAISFLIRNLPGGVMSGYLAERAAPGDIVELTGPMGAFYLRPVMRPLLLLAGGTGLAPFLSMLEELAKRGAEQSVRMYYGVTRDDDLVELSRLEAFSQRLATFSFETIVADPYSPHPRKGFVTDHIVADDLNLGDVDVYLCGPPPMVEAVRNHIAKLGISPRNFYFEKFNPADAASTAEEIA
ncbi:benzoate 1,2-dioxygenase electron transfer component BenC [Sphingomonadaceae bacterium jetA1]|uniref:benzoate 1,2-dioxygenase electron transfer component BenC n=1 Tax=Facivitalis istanbulensis TaxID=3075838 RepID=UPI00348ADA01